MNPYVNATKVSLVKGGDTFTLKLEGAKVKSFTSKNKKIATVSKKGVVTAKGKGSTTIVVKTTTGKTYSCKITVDAPKLNKTKLTLNKGESYKLKLSGTKQEITWKSSNTKVATVTSEGKVVAVNKGTAKITATIGGKKYTCKVTVKMSEVNEEIPHIHKYTEKVTKSPTCTAAGEKKFTCSCGDFYIESIEKLGHNYQWDVTKKPSETAAQSSSDFGTRDLICQNCKDNKVTETIINIGTKWIYGYFDKSAAIELVKAINDLRKEQGHSETIKILLPETTELTQIAEEHILESIVPYVNRDEEQIGIISVEMTETTEDIRMFVQDLKNPIAVVREICEDWKTEEAVLTQEFTSIGAACFYMLSSDYDVYGNGGTYTPYWSIIFELP